MSASAHVDVSNLPKRLCLHCGLCCNGVIFADVRLQPGDDAARLQHLGLPVSCSPSRPKFPQPCAGLAGCHCRLYADRPHHCREFECALFKSVAAGRLGPAAALRIIRVARARADRVRRLLQALGDADEQVALSVRCRRIAKRLSRGNLDRRTAHYYAQLTQTHHQLILLLAQAFYPGSGELASSGR